MDVSGILRDSLVLSHALPCQMIATAVWPQVFRLRHRQRDQAVTSSTHCSRLYLFRRLASHRRIARHHGYAAALTQNGRQLPGVAQVAIQQGRYVGRLIADRIAGRDPRRPFRYLDKGNMAVVGRNFALLESRWLRLSGYFAWVIWGTVHLMFLPQMQNRLRVGRQCIWWQITNQRSSRIILEHTESPVRVGAPAAASARAFVKELQTEHS